MAITLGTQTDFTPTGNASSPQTQSVVVADGTNTLVLIVTIFDVSATDGVVSGVTFNTTENFTFREHQWNATAGAHLEIWDLDSPTITTGDVVVSFGGTVTDFMATVQALSTDAGSIAFDSVPTGTNGNGSATITTGTPSAADSVSFGAMLSDQSVGSRITSNYTTLYVQDIGSDTVGASARVQSSATATIFTWTDTDNDEDWAAIAAVYSEGGATPLTVNCQAGTITPAGQVTTILKGAVSADTQSGTIALSGQTATISSLPPAQSISCQAGSLTLVGQAETVLKGGVQVDGQAGSLAISGQSVTVLKGAVIIAPASSGSSTLSGQTATILKGAVQVDGQVGNLAIAGQLVTTLKGAVTIGCQAGSLGVSGQSASVSLLTNITIECLSGGLATSGQSATIAQAINCQAVSSTLAGQTTTLIKGSVQVDVQAGTSTLSGQTSTILKGAVQVLSQSGILTLAGQDTVVSAISGISIICQTGSLSLVGQSSTVFRGTVESVSGTMSLLGQTATIIAGAVSIDCQTGNISSSGQLSTVEKGAVLINSQAGNLSLAGQSISILKGSVLISSQAGSLSLAGQSISILKGSVLINSQSGNLSLAGQPPAISNGTFVINSIISCQYGIMNISVGTSLVSIIRTPQEIGSDTVPTSHVWDAYTYRKKSWK